jgi:hypothetical protein
MSSPDDRIVIRQAPVYDAVLLWLFGISLVTAPFVALRLHVDASIMVLSWIGCAGGLGTLGLARRITLRAQSYFVVDSSGLCITNGSDETWRIPWEVYAGIDLDREWGWTQGVSYNVFGAEGIAHRFYLPATCSRKQDLITRLVLRTPQGGSLPEVRPLIQQPTILTTTKRCWATVALGAACAGAAVCLWFWLLHLVGIGQYLGSLALLIWLLAAVAIFLVLCGLSGFSGLRALRRQEGQELPDLRQAWLNKLQEEPLAPIEAAPGLTYSYPDDKHLSMDATQIALTLIMLAFVFGGAMIAAGVEGLQKQDPTSAGGGLLWLASGIAFSGLLVILAVRFLRVAATVHDRFFWDREHLTVFNKRGKRVFPANPTFRKSGRSPTWLSCYDKYVGEGGSYRIDPRYLVPLEDQGEGGCLKAEVAKGSQRFEVRRQKLELEGRGQKLCAGVEDEGRIQVAKALETKT